MLAAAPPRLAPAEPSKAVPWDRARVRFDAAGRPQCADHDVVSLAAGDEGDDDVGRVAIEVLPAPVVDRRSPWICVPGGELHVPQRDPGVEGRHDEGGAQHVRVNAAEPCPFADRADPPMGRAPIETMSVSAPEDRALVEFTDGQVDRAGGPGDEWDRGRLVVTELPRWAGDGARRGAQNALAQIGGRRAGGRGCRVAGHAVVGRRCRSGVYLLSVDAGELESLGLYDPTDEHAALQMELLRYLIELGASADDLVTYRDMLPGLAAVLAIRGGPTLTVEEVGQRSGLTIDEVRRLVRAAGFPDPQPDARVLTEGFAALAANASAVADVFGEEAQQQLLRVMGSAMARVADAVVSAFLVNVEPAARREDPVGLGVARANVGATALLPLVAPALDLLFRQHLLAAQRTVLADADLVGYETQRLVVGFVDLVGSTELGEQLSFHDLGGVLTTFEQLAADTIAAGGGRMVKLIGDQVLYTSPDAGAACTVALDLSEACGDHPRMPPVRAGLAIGRVMLRDGDVFGPVVNLAARAVKVAQPGEVMATADVADAAGLGYEPRGPHRLKGVAGHVELRRLIRT